uniref:Uncharacterized protein n=3 Tax=Anabas testudineus TaxID=64144 RepID=A0A7N6A500_ANATE
MNFQVSAVALIGCQALPADLQVKRRVRQTQLHMTSSVCGRELPRWFFLVSTEPDSQSGTETCVEQRVPAPVPAQVSLRVSGTKMTFYRLLSAVLVPTLWLFVAAAEDGTKPAPGSTAAPRPAATNSTHGLNSTQGDAKSSGGPDPVDSSMIQRALYVLIGITTIGVLYFLIRAVRLKKPIQRKKYGLLSNYDDSVEMEAVESDEDDTLYEARSLRRSEVNTQQHHQLCVQKE